MPLPEPWGSLPEDDYAVWLIEWRRRVWEPAFGAGEGDGGERVCEGEGEEKKEQAAEPGLGAPRADEGVGAPNGGAPSGGVPSGVDEAFVQQVWAEQHLRTGPHATERGRTLEIVGPGRWNDAGGPDFRGAELTLDGRAVRGDIEIHTRASGWRDHGHDRDFEYNRVVLHVFLDNDDGQKTDRLQNGDKIERLCLRSILDPDLDTLRASLDGREHAGGAAASDGGAGRASDLGTCHEAVKRLDRRALERFLDLAARERMEGKVARLAALAGDDLAQGVYQALMTYLGQGPSKPLFFLLARRAPLADLRLLAGRAPRGERVLALQSILLHVAGLVPDAAGDEALDDSTRTHLAVLRHHWRAHEQYLSDRIMPPTRRWFAGVRPGNFGTRLVAGMAHLVARMLDSGGDLADAVVRFFPQLTGGGALTKSQRRKLIKSLALGLTVDAPHDWWATHYSFTAKPAASAMKLIGPSRADLMAFNALLPGTILIARRRNLPLLEELCWRLYDAWPTLQENAVTRAMTWRLFAGDPAAADVLVSEARMQALFQIHHDCCAAESPGGGGCATFGAPRR